MAYTLENLQQYATLLGARLEVAQDPLRNCVNVFMPQTKYEAKHNVQSAMLFLPADHSLFDNIQVAYQFMKDWEEYWTLFNSTKKTEIKEFIQKKLRTDPKWITKALILIFNHQTVGEQTADQTVIRNNVGFTGHDGQILSKFAKWFLANKPITEKMMAVLKKSMPKYWHQVYDCCDKRKLLKQIRAAYPAEQMTMKLLAKE
jgi:hypothetical protein